MTVQAFLRGPEAGALLERASQAAGTPLSIHFVERNQEGLRLTGWGSCAACRHVAQLPGGKASCRASRATASAMALQQERPLPFVCHMGFACTSVPALAGEGYVLTFGPYAPQEESRSLEYDALQGLGQLTGELPETLPFSLEEIHRAPLTSIPAIATWTTEALAALWARVRAEEAASEEPIEAAELEDNAPAPLRDSQKNAAAPRFVAQDIAAALLGGNQPLARSLLETHMAERRTGKRMRLAKRRPQMTAAVAAVLEAAEQAGFDSGSAWDAFGEFLGAVRAAHTDKELLDAGMGLLGIVRREAAPRSAPGTSYVELNVILQERLQDGITLGEAAQALGESPSAISHRLKRKFGMSFSEYVGRLRIDRAKELLRRTRLNATEIGSRVGINDQSNFGKIFKKFEGITPMEYRSRFGGREK